MTFPINKNATDKLLKLNFLSEALALLFGFLVILLNFGDDHTGPTIGNLDTIFGLRLWPTMDIIYPLGSIGVFLAYGVAKSNGGLRLSARTMLPLVIYLFSLFLISVDDISDVLNLGLTLPRVYWEGIMWLYPAVSIVCFLWFGEANKRPY
jgi:hypothetical protein